MSHKGVYVGRVVRGRPVVVGYQDMHLVGYREGLCESQDTFSAVCRAKIEAGSAVSGILGQFKEADGGQLRPLGARGR